MAFTSTKNIPRTSLSPWGPQIQNTVLSSPRCTAKSLKPHTLLPLQDILGRTSDTGALPQPELVFSTSFTTPLMYFSSPVSESRLIFTALQAGKTLLTHIDGEIQTPTLNLTSSTAAFKNCRKNLNLTHTQVADEGWLQNTQPNPAPASPGRTVPLSALGTPIMSQGWAIRYSGARSSCCCYRAEFINQCATRQ